MTKSKVATSPETVKRNEKSKPQTFRRTDSGNAELFAHLYKDRLRFDHKQKRWLAWRGDWWEEDATETVVQMAKNAARLRLQSAVNIADEDLRKKEAEWAVNSESRTRIESVLRLGRAELPLADPGTNWDSNLYLFGVANGVVDLKTGRLRSGKQSDKITLHSDVIFDPRAQAPRWEQFLGEIFEGDRELIDYIHRALGYSITGNVNEQCLFFCNGLGANGKSTFLDVLHHTFGAYACNLPFSALELKSRAPIPSEIAGLVGRRFVTAIETNETTRLNEGRIKALTGCDPITARFLYSEWFTYQPSAKYWLAFNNKPQIVDDSQGLWRRVRMIPFEHRFSAQEADPKLPDALKAEAPGILAWLVRGSLKWQAEGLEAPDHVKAATNAYREESDPLADYLAERCAPDSKAQVSARTLYLDYREWAQANGEGNPLSRLAFSRCLQSHGITRGRSGHDRTWTWFGICRRIDTSVQELDLGK
jgi:putative DNA primase/helicase